MKISIITTCKGRLHHLRQVIPSWIQFDPYEIIVVDVKSPDGLSDWLLNFYPQIKRQFLDNNGFNVAEARNLGATVATGDYLLFVDADVHLSMGLNEWFHECFYSHEYAVRFRENAHDGIHEQGTVLVSKKNFLRVEGYDEVFSGYGGEDHDFFEKLERAGCSKAEFPKALLWSIEHSDEERTKFYRIKCKQTQSIINRVYRSAKRAFLNMTPGEFELPLEVRNRIWTEVNAKLCDGPHKMATEKLVFSSIVKRWLPSPYYLEEKFVISLEVKTRSPHDNRQNSG